jgi:catechol 2,3-dioxygenase-like lactoylglutathione lyase family enzyme
MLQHIAIEVTDSAKAEQFFTHVLGLTKRKSATLTPGLNHALFGNNTPVDMVVYGNDDLCIETFVTGCPVTPSYQHICLLVPDKGRFLDTCRAHDVTIITAQKGDKELLFIKDHSGNLYEIRY